MTHRRHILAVVFLLFTGTISAQVAVEQRLDSMEMLIGEHVHLTLSATVGKGKHAVFPQMKEGSLLTPGIEVLGISPVDTAQTEDGKMVYRQVYTLTSFDDTLYYIPPLPVSVDGKKYEGKSLALKVLTVEVDTANKDSMLIPFGVQSEPVRWTDWLPLALAALAIIGLLLLLLWLRHRLKDNKPIEIKIRFIRRQPAHQKALKALNKLDKRREELHVKNEGQDDERTRKEYYTRLTDILRAYIGERYGFNAKEMTTAEITAHLQSQPISAVSEKQHSATQLLSDILSDADLVKFARYAADDKEQERHVKAAMQYVNDTKTGEVATEEKQAEPLNTDQQRIRRQRIWIKAGITLAIVLMLAAAAFAAWQVNWLIE